MINARGSIISIRKIEFDGATYLDGQKRGENIIKIHYQTLVKRLNNEKGFMEYIVAKDNTIIINGEFGDDELREGIGFVKKFATKLLAECNVDEGKNIDTAIEKIQKEESSRVSKGVA